MFRGDYKSNLFGDAKSMGKNRADDAAAKLLELKQRVRELIEKHWTEIEEALKVVTVSIYFPEDEDDFAQKFKDFMLIIISDKQQTASTYVNIISNILKPAFDEAGLLNFWIGTNFDLVRESRESPTTSPEFQQQKLPAMIKSSTLSNFPRPAGNASPLQARIVKITLKGMKHLKDFVDDIGNHAKPSQS